MRREKMVEFTDNGCKALGLAIVEQAVTDHEKDLKYLVRKCKKGHLNKNDLDHMAVRYGYVKANRRFFKDQYTPVKTISKKSSIQYNLLTDIDGERLCNAIERRLHFSDYEDIVINVLDKYREMIKNIDRFTDIGYIKEKKEAIIIDLPFTS